MRVLPKNVQVYLLRLAQGLHLLVAHRTLLQPLQKSPVVLHIATTDRAGHLPSELVVAQQLQLSIKHTYVKSVLPLKAAIFPATAPMSL